MAPAKKGSKSTPQKKREAARIKLLGWMPKATHIKVIEHRSKGGESYSMSPYSFNAVKQHPSNLTWMISSPRDESWKQYPSDTKLADLIMGWLEKNPTKEVRVGYHLGYPDYKRIGLLKCTWKEAPKQPTKTEGGSPSKPSTPRPKGISDQNAANAPFSMQRSTPLSMDDVKRCKEIIHCLPNITNEIPNVVFTRYHITKTKITYEQYFRNAVKRRGRYSLSGERVYYNSERPLKGNSYDAQVINLLDNVNWIIREDVMDGSDEFIVLVPREKVKTTPKPKPNKPSVKVAKKLLAEGKLPEGHVRRLGTRRQTPPKAKSQADDRARKAMRAGYRVSKNGNLYYEARANRSDTPKERKDYAYRAAHLKGTRKVKKVLGKTPDKYAPRILSIFKPNPAERGDTDKIYYLDNKKIKTDKVLTEAQQWAVVKKIMRKYRKSKVEFTFAVDKYGNMLYHSKGTENHCSGPAVGWYEAHIEDRLIDVHSHPSYSSVAGFNWHGNTCTFSEGDLAYYHSRYVWDAAVFGNDNRIFRIQWNDRQCEQPFPINYMKVAYDHAHDVSESEAPQVPEVMDAVSNLIEASQAGKDQSVIDKLKEKHSHLLHKAKVDIAVRTYIEDSKKDGRFTFTEDKL